MIYLFGSYARGDYNEHSDYDFYVVMPGAKKIPIEEAAKAYSCLDGMKRRPMDIVVNNEAMFAKRREWLNTLENTVAREGIVVYPRKRSVKKKKPRTGT